MQTAPIILIQGPSTLREENCAERLVQRRSHLLARVQRRRVQVSRSAAEKSCFPDLGVI